MEKIIFSDADIRKAFQLIERKEIKKKLQKIDVQCKVISTKKIRKPKISQKKG